MDATARLAAAHSLLTAYESREAVDPLVQTYPDITMDDAYEIQQLQRTHRVAAGATVVGHKIGLTSAAMQRQLGVDQPDYGFLTDDMVHVEQMPVRADRFVQPRIEPEVAFVLKNDLTGPRVTVAQALAAVDFVLPALEIIDSRVRDWKIGLLDTIADNASSGGVVLGSRPSPVEVIDLRVAGCLFHVNGKLIATGAGGAVLGSPLTALVWLANTLGERGVKLGAGEVVLSGSITAAAPVAAGDSVTATIAGLGSVTARFS